MRELTFRGIVLGGIITLLFTAANVYLGLKIGLTFATSIPAAYPEGVTPPDEYAVYGDQPGAEPPTASTRRGRAAPVCPGCGSNDFEDGFVEGTGDSLVRYFVGPREEGLFGVRRLGLERRTVIARRCLDCSRLDLFADDSV